MESISGLPAHPLLVHAPVVLIPLTTLFTLALMASPRLRRRAGWGLALSALVTLIATQLAISSGYAFDELTAGAVDTEDHEHLALDTRNFVALFVLASLATAALDRWGHAEKRSWVSPLTWSTMALTTISSVMATAWAVQTGEEGARLVWDGVLTAFAPM